MYEQCDDVVQLVFSILVVYPCVQQLEKAKKINNGRFDKMFGIILDELTNVFFVF